MLCPKPGAKKKKISVIVVHGILDGKKSPVVTYAIKVCACVRACVRACVCACVRAGAYVYACMYAFCKISFRYNSYSFLHTTHAQIIVNSISRSLAYYVCVAYLAIQPAVLQIPLVCHAHGDINGQSGRTLRGLA